jgi:hypothetical protein
VAQLWKRDSPIRSGAYATCKDEMSKVLRSWKAVALYVGKGVRTVQRWEVQLGFPIRRNPQHLKGRIVAHTDDIDSWLHSNFSLQLTELEHLRQQLARLSAENEELRRQLALFQNEVKTKAATQL